MIQDKNFYFSDHMYAKVPGQENHRYPFIKIVDDRTLVYEKNTIKEETGVWADIFPIDFCGDTQEKATKLAQRQKEVFNEYLEYLKLHENDSLINILKNFYLMGYRMRSRQNMTYVVDRTTELGTLIETYQKLDAAQQNRLMGYMQAMLEQ